jgi:hypothetical protein
MTVKIRESSVVASCLNFAKKFDFMHFEKVFGGGMGNAGKPDLDGCVCGITVKAECKAPGGKLSDLQTAKLKQWENAGAVVGVVYSKEEFVELCIRACERASRFAEADLLRKHIATKNVASRATK